MSEVELTPVRAGHEFDQWALHKFLDQHLSDYRGPFHATQFEGGQSNPTFLLETNSQRYVLRKQPPGNLLPSAHAVDREFKVMDALRDSDVPVPQMYTLCEDPSIIGTKFYIMSMVDGRLFSKSALPDLDKAERRAIYMDMARVLAALHKVDVAKVGLSDFGRPGNYFGRQISRWSKQYRASETEKIEAMDFLIDWLPDHLPAEVQPVVVHGDYRLGNLLIDESTPQIVAVLDWELSTLGDGLADLGYWCQDYHADPSETGDTVTSVDLNEYGIPHEQEIIEAYCEAACAASIDNWLFYVAYNFFRSAGIIQGVYKRGLDGNASSEKALEYEGVARRRSELAWRLIQKLERD